MLYILKNSLEPHDLRYLEVPGEVVSGDAVEALIRTLDYSIVLSASNYFWHEAVVLLTLGMLVTPSHFVEPNPQGELRCILRTAAGSKLLRYSYLPRIEVVTAPLGSALVRQWSALVQHPDDSYRAITQALSKRWSKMTPTVVPVRSRYERDV